VSGGPRAVACAALAVLLFPAIVAGLADLPAFGHYPGPYGDIVNTIGVPVRHVTNMVSLVNYDIRGLDTLGEEFILFAATTGVVMLLRGPRGEATAAPPVRLRHRRLRGRSEAVSAIGRWMVPLTAVYGVYVVLHAQLTPGGGFQGGVIIFAALLLIYLGDGYAAWRRLVRSFHLDLAEALGAGIYAVAGLAPLVLGAQYLQNVLPLGQVGSILSGGLIPIVNLGVGIAVAGGFSSIALELLEETREPETGDPAA
jgi:multicomponent Na+:H+ antiporter subunit B